MNSFEKRMLALAEDFRNVRDAAQSSGAVNNFEFFGYSALFGQGGVGAADILPGDALQAIIPIQSDSDFVLSYISLMTVNSLFFTGQDARIRMQINDTGRGIDLYSEPSLPPFISGGGVFPENFGVPFILPIPRVVERNTNIKIDITNTSTGITFRNVFVSLMGVRVYYGD